MQRLWLGDAFDFWKGALLAVLRESATPARPLKVLPMLTDGDWSAADLATYASLLGVSVPDLLTTSTLTPANRTSYFAAWEGLGDDVFLDPDTGVKTYKVTPAYVHPDTIWRLLSDHNTAAVYQHRGRARVGWLADTVRTLRGTGAAATGYEAGAVGMVFVTRSQARDKDLRAALSRRFGIDATAQAAIARRLL
jgi:ketosteroid isomerase-like protein